MNQRILTDLEKQRIRRFMEDRKHTPAIDVLRYRAKKFLPVIEKEVDLLKKLLESSPKDQANRS